MRPEVNLSSFYHFKLNSILTPACAEVFVPFSAQQITTIRVFYLLKKTHCTFSVLSVCSYVEHPHCLL